MVAIHTHGKNAPTLYVIVIMLTASVHALLSACIYCVDAPIMHVHYKTWSNEHNQILVTPV